MIFCKKCKKELTINDKIYTYELTEATNEYIMSRGSKYYCKKCYLKIRLW